MLRVHRPRYRQPPNEWHVWFAWWPVRVPFGPHIDERDCRGRPKQTQAWARVWLEPVERKNETCVESFHSDGKACLKGKHWFYRLTEEQTAKLAASVAD